MDIKDIGDILQIEMIKAKQHLQEILDSGVKATPYKVYGAKEFIRGIETIDKALSEKMGGKNND